MKKKEVIGKQNLLWKALAITFIVVFSIILTLGLLRVYHFKSSFQKATDDEISRARSIAYGYMISGGENITMEDIRVSEKIRGINQGYPNESRRKVIEASVSEGNTKDVFLIDLDSEQIVMHSQTEVFGWLNNSRFINHQRPGRNERR